jgi:hypothetical protein
VSALGAGLGLPGQCAASFGQRESVAMLFNQAGALAGDLQYLLIVRPDASYRWLLRERANRSDWRISEHDLSAYAGQTIAVQFGVYNDNAGGITAMHVDDVTLTVCLRK